VVDGSVATYYSPWTVAARCLRGVSSSSTVARERKIRCHIRRFIGPLCCCLIPLRAVLFARLLHLLLLKINSLALPCAPPGAPARALASALPPQPSPPFSPTLTLLLSFSLALFLSPSRSLALSPVLARASRLVTRPTHLSALSDRSRTLSRTSRAPRPTDRPTNQPFDSLESRRWHCVAAHCRLSPLPPSPLPPPPPQPPPPSPSSPPLPSCAG